MTRKGGQYKSISLDSYGVAGYDNAVNCKLDDCRQGKAGAAIFVAGGGTLKATNVRFENNKFGSFQYYQAGTGTQDSSDVDPLPAVTHKEVPLARSFG